MEHSTIFKDFFQRQGSVLLRDFIELRNMRISSMQNVKKFALASYRKALSLSIENIIDLNIENVSIMLPKHIQTAKTEFTPIGNIIEELNLERYELSFDQSTCLISSTLNVDAKKTRIILNPVDGFVCFVNGIGFFSMSIALQDEVLNNKFATVFSFVSDPLNQEDFMANPTISTLNKTKLVFNDKNPTEVDIGDSLSLSFLNHNLSLCYLSANRVSEFKAEKIFDEPSIVPGMYIASKAGIKILTTNTQNGPRIFASSDQRVVKLKK